MTERRVRLLYKTTCWTCDASIPASTSIWWDDDRRHATCTGCAGERDAQGGSSAGSIAVTGADGAIGPGTSAGVGSVDHRTRRRMEIIRAGARTPARVSQSRSTPLRVANR